MRKPLSAGVTRHEASVFIRVNPRQSVAKPFNPSALFHSGFKLKFGRRGDLSPAYTPPVQPFFCFDA
jgi:hypothetical protein